YRTVWSFVRGEGLSFKKNRSANPNVDIIRALKPTLLSIKGPLIFDIKPVCASRLLVEHVSKHFGADGNPSILVAQAASQAMNPCVDMDWIAQQFAEDPAGSEAGYNAQFRTDVETFVDRDIIESCVELGCFEIPPWQVIFWLR
ncbi:MAG: hypothetical protein ACRENG_27870, partial [bacterium]